MTRADLIEAASEALTGHFTPVVRLSDLPVDRKALREHQRAGGDLMDSQDDIRQAATAALDAILDKMEMPGEEMLRAGAEIQASERIGHLSPIPVDPLYPPEGGMDLFVHKLRAYGSFRAMLQTLREG